MRILLATDAASEASTSRTTAHRLIHYEIPWNPNRLEQRNGRIDRHGQRATRSRLPLRRQGLRQPRDRPADPSGELEGDLEFLMRAAIKVETIREDLGKVGPVIAAQVEEAMLGRRRTLDTAHAEQEAQAPRPQLLKFERNLREQISTAPRPAPGDPPRAARGSPENVQAVVESPWSWRGSRALEPISLAGVASRADAKVFTCRRSAGAGRAAPRGWRIRTPARSGRSPSTTRSPQGRDDVVLAHLNHRLVQMCAAPAPRRGLGAGGLKRLHRVTARLVAGQRPRQPGGRSPSGGWSSSAATTTASTRRSSPPAA